MKTPIIQFGTSRFLQAHAALFISQALENGEALGPITVVQTSGDATRADRLKALCEPEGFTIKVEGQVDGKASRRNVQVTSVKRAFSTVRDMPQVMDIVCGEAEIIVSNTSEKGWVPQPSDHAPSFDQSMSFPAKLAHFLAARFASGGRPIQVMPTELVPNNGTVLRDLVLPIAEKLNPELASWISSEVRFVNSLVDRIVSQSLEPAGAVAEPYALWAIEGCEGLILPCKHPAVKVVGSLQQTVNLKLFLLNLSHTYLVENWMAHGKLGATYVRDLMANEDLVSDLRTLFETELLPTFKTEGWENEAQAYFATVLDRFSNPYLDHALNDIATGHAEKAALRVGGFIKWSAEIGVTSDKPKLSALSAKY